MAEPGSLLDLAERGELHPDVAADLRATAERRGMANAAKYRRRLAELVRRSPEKAAGLTTYAEGVDFSYTPTGAFGCVRGSGRTFVCMYVKWAGRGAFEAARAAGLRPVAIYETTGTDYRGGRGAGQYAAHAFEAWCTANGYAGAPVYFTYDEDVLGYGRGGVAHDYALGWRDVIGLARSGAYAQNGLVGQLLDAGLIARQWVTYAWSGGALDPRATLYQNPNGIGVCGVDCDRDRAFQATIGAVGEPPAPPPGPPPFRPSGGQEDRSKVAIATRPAPGDRAIDAAVVGADGNVWGTWATDPEHLASAAWENLGSPYGAKSVSLAWTQDGRQLVLTCHGADDGLWIKVYDTTFGWLNNGTWQKAQAALAP